MALSVSVSVIPNPPQGNNGEMDVFHRFDVVSDASDHYFVNNTNHKKKEVDLSSNVALSNPFPRGVQKKIMQEWKILEKDLPDSIYVRVYENRIDLLRAVIIGASGTPYHDGLYFFDIAFPSDYPNRPPAVCYKSYGLRINPNLYSNGRVCLSLLNTWTGKRNEKWNPNGSTVLQVLISIQALVLNEKPYFNEPGHRIWPGRVIWEQKSNAYNEEVFLLCCKTMGYVMRRPPKNFEGFVVAHFRGCADVILSACRAYFKGQARVGYYHYYYTRKEEGSSTSTTTSSRSTTCAVSEKFKGLMAKLYPELLTDFGRIGASSLMMGCELHDLSNAADNYPTTPSSVANKKKIIAVARRMWGKLNKALGVVLEKKRGGKSKASS